MFAENQSYGTIHAYGQEFGENRKVKPVTHSWGIYYLSLARPSVKSIMSIHFNLRSFSAIGHFGYKLSIYVIVYSGYSWPMQLTSSREGRYLNTELQQGQTQQHMQSTKELYLVSGWKWDLIGILKGLHCQVNKRRKDISRGGNCISKGRTWGWWGSWDQTMNAFWAILTLGQGELTKGLKEKEVWSALGFRKHHSGGHAEVSWRSRSLEQLKQ